MVAENPKDQREWVSFEDPDEHRTWLFDVTFLVSRWTCIYGSGCPGIAEEPDIAGQLGCCSHGAYLSDEQDRSHVEAMISELTPTTWDQGLQIQAAELGGPLWKDKDGWWRTRVTDGACIFQNRPGHPRGAGCAFHQLAETTGRRHMDTKPEICWQAPIRREDHETVTGHIYTMVREWQSRDWGGEETDVSWWCTDDPIAHVGSDALYNHMGGELEAICGPHIYSLLVRELDRRMAGEVPVSDPSANHGD